MIYGRFDALTREGERIIQIPRRERATGLLISPTRYQVHVFILDPLGPVPVFVNRPREVPTTTGKIRNRARLLLPMINEDP